MKLTANASVLRNAIQCVGQAVPSKNVNPVLSGVLIDATGDVVTLSATDTEVAVIKQMDAVTVQRKGSTVVDAKKFADVLSKLSGDVTISESDLVVSIKAGSRSIDLQSMNPDEFPKPRVMDDREKFASVTMNSDKFLNALNNVKFAASMEENARYAVHGVHVNHTKSGELEFVGTDTKRLAVVKESTDEELNKDIPAPTIPVKVVGLICRNLESGVDATVKWTRNQIMVQSQSTMVFGLLLGGKFPPYNLIIPRIFSSKCVVDPKQFHDAISCAATVADTESKRVSITFKSGSMDVSSKSKFGKSDVSCDVVEYDGPNVSVDVDPSYMLQYLSNSPTNVTIKLNGSGGALMMDNGVSSYLVMPMATD